VRDVFSNFDRTEQPVSKTEDWLPVTIVQLQKGRLIALSRLLKQTLVCGSLGQSSTRSCRNCSCYSYRQPKKSDGPRGKNLRAAVDPRANLNPARAASTYFLHFCRARSTRSLCQSGLRMQSKAKRLTGKHLASKMFDRSLEACHEISHKADRCAPICPAPRVSDFSTGSHDT
jgi:hypothetical protein